ncbi:MAG: hypothetical protein Q9186_001464 [Xanthomendoza sp. 1 TL-2023]
MLPGPILSIGSLTFVLGIYRGVNAGTDPGFEDPSMQDLHDFLATDNHLSQRSSASEKPRLVSFTWTPTSRKAIPGFNISMDISGCGKSLRKNTLAGIYTYPNGTTKNDATVGDILADLRATKMNAPDVHTGQVAMKNHMLTSAQTVQAMSNRLLDRDLVCKPPRDISGGEVIPNELRRLLFLSREATREILFLLCVSLSAAIPSGLIAGAMAYFVGDPGANAPAGTDASRASRIRQYAGVNALTAAISTFISTLAAGIVEYLATRRRVRATQGFTAEVSLAVMRRAIQDFEERQARPAAQSTTTTSTSTSRSLGTGASSSSSPTATPFPAIGACVDEDEVVDAANALAGPLLSEWSTSSHALGIYVPRADLEAGMGSEVLVHGVCQLVGR